MNMFKFHKKIYLFSRLIVFCFSLLFCSSSWAEKTLTYKTTHPGTGVVLQTFSARVEHLSDGGRKINWDLKENTRRVEEQYVLDAMAQTLSWQVTSVEENTDYSGARQGNILWLEGVFKGKDIKKSLRIDQDPFYVNPKFGLRAFVQSGQKTIKFWGLRSDNLSLNKMVAINQGEETVSINGQDIPAVKVEWTVAGFGSAFFKRYYWFRKSDGLYIRQEVDGGYIRELFDEKG